MKIDKFLINFPEKGGYENSVCEGLYRFCDLGLEFINPNSLYTQSNNLPYPLTKRRSQDACTSDHLRRPDYRRIV